PPWLEPAPSASEVSGAARPVDQNVGQPSRSDSSEPELPLTVPRSSTHPQPVGDGRSLHDAALNNLRAVVSEADELGDASARAVKSARESFAAVAAPPPPYDHADEQPTPQDPRDDLPTPEMLEPTFSADEPRPAVWSKALPPEHAAEESEAQDRPAARPRSYRELMRVAVSLFVLACIAGLVAWQWPAIALFYRWARTPAVVEAPKEPPPANRPKIADRLDPGGQQAPAPPPGASPGAAPGAAVAQRVVLYEEDPTEAQGKRFVGSAIWRTE